MGYVYGGTEKDTVRPATWAKSGPKSTGLAPFDPSKCGTNAGYQQHGRHGRPKCDRCRVAMLEYQAEYRARNRRAA